MTMTPLPTQLSGAAFLASRTRALLADAPRCGKTGAALMAADYILAKTILIVTTASGRGVWLKAVGEWTVVLGRSVEIMTPSNAAKIRADVVIVGWPSIADPKVRSALLRKRWDLLLLDESHYAKSFDAKRTQAVYGTEADTRDGLARRAATTWALSGTPAPHSPLDLFPMMLALCPDRLEGVETFEKFRDRYCIVRMKKISQFNRIPVIIGGRNEDELAERLKGFFLLRTQADVGIRAPIYETLPLIVSEKMKREATGGLDATRVLLAAERGDTRELEMHLGPLRRLTGEIKARAVVDAVRDEFESGLDKIVLMYWHRDVGQILKDGLAKFGVTGIDGSTPAKARDAAVAAFRLPGGPRVFLGQIVAAGEAIDLSAAAVLWFVETSMVPKDMSQASLRITNNQKSRQAFVKVVTLQGSIDEAIQARLMLLWSVIRKVMK